MKCPKCKGSQRVRCSTCQYNGGKVRCKHCRGSGKQRPDSDGQDCTWCAGEGWKTCERCEGSQSLQCGECGGTGQVWGDAVAQALDGRFPEYTLEQREIDVAARQEFEILLPTQPQPRYRFRLAPTYDRNLVEMRHHVHEPGGLDLGKERWRFFPRRPGRTTFTFELVRVEGPTGPGRPPAPIHFELLVT